MVETLVRNLMRWTAIGLILLSTAGAAEKPRLLVLTDIGGDPDDQQSLIRLLVHANEFEIEGLIASAAGTPGELKKEAVMPELIRAIVEAYGKVQPNLQKHHPDFPEAKKLLGRIKVGNPERGRESLGADKDTEGSLHIIACVDRSNDRPLNVVIWGGSTELAQALWKVRNDRKPEELRAFLKKIRVYDISHQDNTGPWINEEFPDLLYVLSKAPKGKDKRDGGYRGMYLGGDESLTSRAWVDRHVRKERGPLGALYPTATWTAPNPHSTLKEGDTPSLLYFLPVGLSAAQHPEWGCWGGRFRNEAKGLYVDAADTANQVTNARSTVSRWRPAYQNEFQARMDWCVKGVREANHPPVAVLNKDLSQDALQVAAKPGETVTLSASGSSDPDNNALSYRWFVYREPGTYEGEVKIENADKIEAKISLPADAKEKSIHVILEVSDDGSPKLTRYRRAILSAR